jgi:hypothetical protein
MMSACAVGLPSRQARTVGPLTTGSIVPTVRFVFGLPSTEPVQTGAIHTQWQDTHIPAPTLAGAAATLMRRYVVTWKTEGRGTLLRLQVELQRCSRAALPSVPNNRCERVNRADRKVTDELDLHWRQFLRQFDHPPDPRHG